MLTCSLCPPERPSDDAPARFSSQQDRRVFPVIRDQHVGVVNLNQPRNEQRLFTVPRNDDLSDEGFTMRHFVGERDGLARYPAIRFAATRFSKVEIRTS